MDGWMHGGNNETLCVQWLYPPYSNDWGDGMGAMGIPGERKCAKTNINVYTCMCTFRWIYIYIHITCMIYRRWHALVHTIYLSIAECRLCPLHMAWLVLEHNRKSSNCALPVIKNE